MNQPPVRRVPIARIVALTLAALAFAGLVRVVVAPLELPVGGLVERLARERTGTDLSIGRVAVAVGLGGVRLVVADVGIRTPTLSASVDAVTLTQGIARRIAVAGFALRIDPSARRGPPALPPPKAAVAALDAALATLGDAAHAAGLADVAVTDGRIDVVSAGRPIGEARVFQNIAATARFGDGLALEATMIGADGGIAVRLSRRVEAGISTIEAAADGIVPADLGPAGAIQSGFALSPRLVAHRSADGAATAALSLDVGAGSVILGADPMRRLDSARLELAAPADRDVVLVRRAEIVAGNSDVDLTGTLTPGATPLDPWSFTLDGAGSTLESEDLGLAPVVLDAALIEGRLDLAGSLLFVDRLRAEASGGEATATFTFDFGPNGPRNSGALHVGQSSVATLLGAWPAILAHEPRQIVAASVKGGAVTSIDFDFGLTREDLDGDPTTNNPGSVSVDAQIVDGTLATPDIPVAVRHASGALRLRDRVMSVRLDSGVVAGDEGGELAVRTAAMTIPDLAAKPPQASLSATVEGPIAAVIGVAQMMKLEDFERLAVHPADVSGTVKADVAMVTPLAPAVTMAERRWSVDAILNNAASKVPMGGQVFTDANLRVAANSRRLAAIGRAKVGGITIDVNYTELFSGEKTGEARFVLTDKDRKDRGFDLGDGMRGPVTVTLEQGGNGENSFAADFTETDIKVPGFRKAAGQSLMAIGIIKGDAPDVDVSGLEVDGGGLSVAGSLSLTKKGLRRAELERFALSEGDRARVSVGGAGDGYRIDVEATQFDARALVAAAKSGTSAGGGADKAAADKGGDKGGADKGGQPLTLTARGTRVRLTDSAHVSDLSLEASYDGRRIVRLAGSGRLDGVNAGSFGVHVAPEAAGGRRVQGDVADLGRMLAALGLYQGMRGGRATVDGRIGDDGVLAGRLTVGSFLLADERSLEDIIAVARPPVADRELPGALAVPAADRGPGGVSFDKMAIDFEKRGDRVVVKDAILRGQLIGGTASGEVDLKAGTVNLTGTLIPAFGVNNLFGRMPVVGTLLGAGKTGGLIGVTFRLDGPLGDPKLAWNPLSAVAPGILRRVFEYR